MLLAPLNRKRKLNQLVGPTLDNRINRRRRMDHIKKVVESDSEESESESEEGEHDHSDKIAQAKKQLKKLFGGGSSKKGFFGGGDDNEVYRKDNHIYFKSDVDTDSISKLTKLITEYNDLVKNKKRTLTLFEESNLQPKPLYLHISSYGGLLHEAMLAYDHIKNSQVPIHTVIEGYAASAGTVLSVAGVKRYMTANSEMLIHQLRGGMYGTYKEMEDDFLNSKEHMERIIQIYLDNCKGKMTKRQIQDALDHDRYWGASQGMSKGLVDEVYTGQH